MNHFSLFTGSGIGDYAAEQCGFETVAQSENDPACLFCLSRMFPNAKRFSDIKSITDDDVRRLGRIDLISGGFPCQDISSAGKGAGLDGDRSSLWFEMLRIINVARPAWLLIENVPALRVRGADRVFVGLEESGYTCWPHVVGSWAVGAPHKRDRVWIVGHANTNECERKRISEAKKRNNFVDFSGASETVADAEQDGLRQGSGITRDEEKAKRRRSEFAGSVQLADAHKTRREKCVCIGSNDGTQFPPTIGSRWPARPGEQQHEWEASRLVEFSMGNATDGLAGRVHSKANKQLLRMAGNGWCFPVALMFFQWIAEQIQTEAIA